MEKNSKDLWLTVEGREFEVKIFQDMGNNYYYHIKIIPTDNAQERFLTSTMIKPHEDFERYLIAEIYQRFYNESYGFKVLGKEYGVVSESRLSVKSNDIKNVAKESVARIHEVLGMRNDGDVVDIMESAVEEVLREKISLEE